MDCAVAAQRSYLLEMSMKFGVLLDLRNSARAEWFIPWPELYAGALDHMVELEHIGFDAVSLCEHHADPEGYNPGPITTLAAALTRTKTLRVGTNITQLPFHHPVLFAEEVTTLDIISGGRVDIGLGQVGRAFDMEFELLGFNPRQRGTRFDEILQIMLRAWSEDEPFDFQGKHFDLKGVWVYPKPLQRPHPPVWVVAQAEASMERAARLGLGAGGPGGGFTSIASPTWRGWLAQWHAALARYGRAPESTPTNIFVTSFITDDPEKAWATHRLGIMEHFNYVRDGKYAYSTMFGGEPPQTPEDLPNWQHIFLTAEDAIERYKAAYAGAAPSEIHVLGRRFGMSWDESAVYLRNFAERVMPALREL
jgi:alkanesulfonate monooxygenase SsuD/methylene tetrahydromethanopterin reductase-like flavin-dependent oxidoreductase (luciferase family)